MDFMDDDKWRMHSLDENGQIDNGDLFSIEEFAELVAENSVTDEDGIGVWATAAHRSNASTLFGPDEELVFPSTFAPEKAPEDATHVLWFNK